MQIEHFIAQVKAAANVEGLRGVMGRAAADMGLGGFIYVSRCKHRPRRPAADQTVIASFSPQWTARHVEQDPIWVERIIVRAAADELPFFWGEPEPAGAGAPEWPSTDLRLAAGPGADHGWSVPIHDASCRVAVLSFTGAQRFGPFRLNVESHRATLHVMAIYFHAHVRKAPAMQDRAPTVGLTPRELQCLGWAAQGKSRTDIGQIIGVSPRTIKFHLENAQRKLNVAHTTQAVLRAALLGLIATTEEL